MVSGCDQGDGREEEGEMSDVLFEDPPEEETGEPIVSEWPYGIKPGVKGSDES